MYELPPPQDLFAPDRRHLFVFAHQDDDLPYAGLLQRVPGSAEVLWVTNGDGLAPQARMSPQSYAEMREAEAVAAMGELGYGRDQLHFLRHSELTFYQLFAELEDAGPAGAVPGELRRQVTELMGSVMDAVEAQVARADVVWTLAWQGGHPEHDLTHYAAAQAVRRVSRQRGRAIPCFELPAYELLILVPLRFPPWRRGVSHEIRLTARELQRKEAAFDAYPSQARITSAFRRLLQLYGVLSAFRGRPFGFRDFASREQFGPVPMNRDYTRSPHRWQALDYLFEDYEGKPISFHGSVAKIVRMMAE